MKLNAFLTALSKKTGLDLTKPEFKDVLASEIDIPDEMTNHLEKNLLTEEAAKANSKIRNAIKAEVYNGVDSDFESLADEFEIPDDIKPQILSEKKAIDKARKALAYYKEQITVASKDGDKNLVTALKKQVADTKEEIKNFKADSQKIIDQLKADNETTLTEYDVKGKLGLKQFALPEQMKADEKVDFAFVAFRKELAAKGLKLVRENGKATIQKEDGTPAFDEKNNPYDIDSLLDGALAQRGLLKTSDPGKGNGGGSPAGGVPGGVTPSPTQQQYVSELDKEIAALV